jgi:hypothetical protein
LGARANLLARLSGSADLYRHGRFNALALGVSAGPELQLGRDRLAAEAGVIRRWIGGSVYADTPHVGLNYFHPLDRQSQLRATASVGWTTIRRNPLQSGESYAASLGYERALSARLGIGATLTLDRHDARDPGYATSSGRLSLFAYRDIGAATVIGTLDYGRLWADERLFIYPKRRRDHFHRASLGATFRQLAFGGFAPLVRLTYERNRSSIERFDYKSWRTELGITRAF